MRLKQKIESYHLKLNFRKIFEPIQAYLNFKIESADIEKRKSKIISTSIFEILIKSCIRSLIHGKIQVLFDNLILNFWEYNLYWWPLPKYYEMKKIFVISVNDSYHQIFTDHKSC